MPQTRLRLSDDKMCFGCGSRNARGLKLKFSLDRTRRRISTRWTPAKAFQGYADIVHGGMIELILDEVMGNLLWKLGIPVVTAEMTVRFISPARVGQPIVFEAVIRRHRGRVYQMHGTAKSGAGRSIAEASAKYVQIAHAKH